MNDKRLKRKSYNIVIKIWNIKNLCMFALNYRDIPSYNVQFCTEKTQIIYRRFYV